MPGSAPAWVTSADTEGIVGAVEIAALLRTLRTERDVERRSVDGRVDGLVGPVLRGVGQLAFEYLRGGVVGEFLGLFARLAAFGVDRQCVGRLPRTGETAVGLVDLDLRAALGQRGFEADLDFAGATGIWSAASLVEQAAMSVAVAATNNPLVNACFIWMSVLLFFDRIAVGIRHLIAPLVERFGFSAGECLAGCKAGLHDNFRCGDFRTEIGLRPPPEIRNVLLHNHRIVVIFVCCESVWRRRPDRVVPRGAVPAVLASPPDTPLGAFGFGCFAVGAVHHDRGDGGSALRCR